MKSVLPKCITVKNVAISKNLVQSVVFTRTVDQGVSAATAGRETIWVTTTRTGLCVASNKLHWMPSKFLDYTPDAAFARAAAVLWS